uniref:Uncharacterized protein n=1 Tax=Glossina austeni TaxID=7395 RepID=A0A1A9VLM4_GLOAU
MPSALLYLWLSDIEMWDRSPVGTGRVITSAAKGLAIFLLTLAVGGLVMGVAFVIDRWVVLWAPLTGIVGRCGFQLYKVDSLNLITVAGLSLGTTTPPDVGLRLRHGAVDFAEDDWIVDGPRVGHCWENWVCSANRGGKLGDFAGVMVPLLLDTGIVAVSLLSAAVFDRIPCGARIYIIPYGLSNAWHYLVIPRNDSDGSPNISKWTPQQAAHSGQSHAAKCQIAASTPPRGK